MKSRSDLRRKFNKIIKEIEDVNFKQQFRNLRDEIFGKFEAMDGELARQTNRKVTPKSERFVKFMDISTRAIKATYRPDNGEILFKIPDKTPPFKRQMLEDFARKLVDDIPGDVKMTLRGDIEWSDTNQGFWVTLKDNRRVAYKLTFTSFQK